MNLEPLIIVVVVLGVAWIALRWGPFILTGYAIWHLCVGEWTAAGLALLFASFIILVKAPSVWWSRAADNGLR